MLILTRKLKEQIQIGDNIHITVLKISARTVQIGIDAPRDVRVKRTELKAEQTDPTASVESPPFAAIANRTSPALPSESCDALPHRLPADNSRSTSQFPTAVSDPAHAACAGDWTPVPGAGSHTGRQFDAASDSAFGMTTVPRGQAKNCHRRSDSNALW